MSGPPCAEHPNCTKLLTKEFTSAGIAKMLPAGDTKKEKYYKEVTAMKRYDRRERERERKRERE